MVNAFDFAFYEIDLPLFRPLRGRNNAGFIFVYYNMRYNPVYIIREKAEIVKLIFLDCG